MPNELKSRSGGVFSGKSTNSDAVSASGSGKSSPVSMAGTSRVSPTPGGVISMASKDGGVGVAFAGATVSTAGSSSAETEGSNDTAPKSCGMVSSASASAATAAVSLTAAAVASRPG